HAGILHVRATRAAVDVRPQRHRPGSQPAGGSDFALIYPLRMAARRAQAGLARPRPQPGPEVAKASGPANGQLATTAGSAIVTAARVGRLLGRSGWRIAK